MHENQKKVLLGGAITIIFFAMFFISHKVAAGDGQNLELAQIKQLDTNQIVNIIPAPVQDFVNSIQQTGKTPVFGNPAGNIGRINVSSLGVFGDTFNKIDNWFFGTTGFHLRAIWDFLFNLLSGLIYLVINIIKWAFSFLPRGI